MINYDSHKWMTLFRLHGSVLPKACKYAVVPTILTFIVSALDHAGSIDVSSWKIIMNSSAYSSFTWTLSFLLVFRTSQCYARFWSCATGSCTMRAQLYEACSTLFAFCMMSKRPQSQVSDFKYKLVHLFSLLHAVAMASMSGLPDDIYTVVGIENIPEKFIQILQKHDSKHKTEIVYQWINSLVIAELESGLLNVPPPILSRVFQEMEKGMIEYNQVLQIMTLPFPFPYSQVCLVMILGHMMCTPIVMSYYTGQFLFAALFTFLTSAAFFSLEGIAAELENPFGDDPNDLPSHDFQTEMNEGLLLLMHPTSSLFFELKQGVTWGDIVRHDTWHSLGQSPKHDHGDEPKIERVDLLDEETTQESATIPPPGAPAAPAPEMKQQAQPVELSKCLNQSGAAPQPLPQKEEKATLLAADKVSLAGLLAEGPLLPEPAWIGRLMGQQEAFEKELLESLSGIKIILEKSVLMMSERNIFTYAPDLEYSKSDPMAVIRENLPTNVVGSFAGCCTPRPPVQPNVLPSKMTRPLDDVNVCGAV